MKQKLLSAALGVLVLAPSTLLAQDARSLGDSATRMKPVHELSKVSTNHLPQLKTHHRSNGRDSNANGTIIGAAIGGVLGAFLGAGLASINENSDALTGSIVTMAVLGAAGGAGIGYAVDNAHQVTYRIPVSRNVSLQPSVGLDKRPGRATGARAGLSAAFGW